METAGLFTVTLTRVVLAIQAMELLGYCVGDAMFLVGTCSEGVLIWDCDDTFDDVLYPVTGESDGLSLFIH